MADELQPISPESGRKFQDLHPALSLMRGDSYIKALKQFPTADAAVAFLHSITFHTEEPFIGLKQHGALGQTRANVAGFLWHPVTDRIHWLGLFSMLKSAGFEDRDAAGNAAARAILYLKNQDKPLTGVERNWLGQLAGSALDEVYGT